MCGAGNCGSLSAVGLHRTIWLGIQSKPLLSGSYNSAGAGCFSCDREPTWMSATERARDGLEACHRRNTQLPPNPPNESCKKRAKRTPGYGYLPLRHAASPSMGRLGADIPVGSQSQWKVPASRLGFQRILAFCEHRSGLTMVSISPLTVVASVKLFTLRRFSIACRDDHHFPARSETLHVKF